MFSSDKVIDKSSSPKKWAKASKILLLFVLLSAVFILVYPTLFKTKSTGTHLYELTLLPFDQSYPGRGVDSYVDKPIDHAMAYAIYASANARIGNVDRAKLAADYLVEHSAQSNGIGWGLDWAWDAFNDGSVNEVDTIYGVTVAWGVRGLLDVYSLTRDERYWFTAKRALDHYMQFFKETPTGGYFAYSERSSDMKDVHNVNAFLAAQFARAGVEFDIPAFREVSAKAARHIWESRQTFNDEIFWPYGETSNRPNDAVHAAYIVDGLAEISKNLELEIDIRPAVLHLKSFLREGVVYEYPFHPLISESARLTKSRLWGVGMLIHVLATQGENKAAADIVRSLNGYWVSKGVYGYSPGDLRFMPRYQAHLLFGLSSFSTN